MNNKKFDVIVVGGGSSGMFAAGRAAERGKRVLLLEKNGRLGEKLRITGGGRCNITNAEKDIHALLSKYGEARKFLYSSFAEFGVEDTFTFFRSRGLPIVVEEKKRAFPHTFKAIDVYNVLEKYLQENRVECKKEAAVEKIVTENNNITSVIANGETFSADTFIFATGGLSHPETGSTGDGFRWLENLRHKVVKPNPSIVPISVHNAWVKQLAGVSVDDVKISFFTRDKKAFSVRGRILFTHFGLMLNNSVRVQDLLHEGDVTAEIDLYPDTDLGQIDKKVTAVFDTNKNKIFKNIAKELVPAGMQIGFITAVAGIVSGEEKVHSITKDQRKKLCQCLKAMPVSVEGLMGNDKAVVSDGGLLLSEINARTMRSKVVENLFVTGDLLHIRRPSGGYSLQLCWTTGYVAGNNV